MLLKAFLLLVLTSVGSYSAIIDDSGIAVLSDGYSTQTGRLSRNAVISDWSTPVSFPGIINAGVSFGYEAFNIPASPFAYLQISIYDVLNASNLFASAYENAYLPTGTGSDLGLATNFLGYAGTSGNLYGDPRAFQVVLPDPRVNHLVVVVNDTSQTGAGVNQPFQVIVEGFYDTNFTDTIVSETPEPASIFMSCSGLAGAWLFALLARRRSLPVSGIE